MFFTDDNENMTHWATGHCACKHNWRSTQALKQQFCVPGLKNHCTAGIAPIDLFFFPLRAPCHVGGGGADVHPDIQLIDFYIHKVSLCAYAPKKAGGVAGTGTSYRSSSPAGAFSASKHTKTRCGIAVL
jgi:hypothetical protein